MLSIWKILLYIFILTLLFIFVIMEYALLSESNSKNILWNLIKFAFSIALAILSSSIIVTKIVVATLIGR